MNSSPAVRFSYLLQQTAAFIMKHFVILLLANAIPLVISFAVIWLTVGAAVSGMNAASSFAELAALFSLSSPLTYTLIVTGVLALAINLLGWIAGPLITIEQDQISLAQLFPKSLKYFWSFFALSIMVIVAAVFIEMIIFLLITIVITLAGLVDQSLILTVENYLVIIFPDLGILLLLVGLMFAPYLLIEKKLSAWEAILQSVNLVKTHLITCLTRFGLIAIIIIILSFLLQFIPLFGGALAYLISSLIITVYNYYLYKGLTTATNGA